MSEPDEIAPNLADDHPVPITYVRHRAGEPWAHGPYGPKAGDHPTVGWRCEICGEPMAEGQPTGLLALRPDMDDPDMAERAPGRWGNWIALEVHWECVENRDDQALGRISAYFSRGIFRAICK